MMNYKKVELDNINIQKLELLLLQIAKWHNMTPKL